VNQRIAEDVVQRNRSALGVNAAGRFHFSRVILFENTIRKVSETIFLVHSEVAINQQLSLFQLLHCSPKVGMARARFIVTLGSKDSKAHRQGERQ
jgi:hypothetical protein